MRTACSSNSILIKYFLEATNHLPPQRKAHCYVLSLKNISWLWGHKYWSVRCIAWLYLDEFGTELFECLIDLTSQFSGWLDFLRLLTRYVCPASRHRQTWKDLLRLFYCFFGVTCYLLHTFCETIPRLSTPCHHGKNPGILCSGLPSKAKIQNWGHSRFVRQSHRGNWYVWTPNRQLKLPYILGGNSGIGYETVKVSNVCYMCSTSWSIGS